MKSRVKEWAARLRTPRQVQTFLRGLPYNSEQEGVTLRSAESALRSGTCHCLEASFIAAAILEHHGFPPLVMSLESQDSLDHVLFVFQQRGKWGAISRSREEGLHGRAPVFGDWQELAESYYDPYVDDTGRVTAFQVANLDDTRADWRQSSRNVWKAERYLIDIKHRPLRVSKARYKHLFERYRDQGPLVTGPHWW